MTKISGKVLSVKPATLSRAAKHITAFASFDNGSSAAVSTYLLRTADAFNRLVNFHSGKSIRTSDVDRNPDVVEEQDRKFREAKEGKNVDLVVGEGNDKKKKKKKKRKEKGGEDDNLNEKTSSKKKKASPNS